MVEHQREGISPTHRVRSWLGAVVMLLVFVWPVSVHAVDLDGDGVPDAEDNCPIDFNPLMQIQQRINDALVADGTVKDFEISPDGTFVLYAADQDLLDTTELYRVPINGGASAKLSPPLGPNRDVVSGDESGRLSADGTMVVFRSDLVVDAVVDVFSYRTGPWYSVLGRRLPGCSTGSNLGTFGRLRPVRSCP